MQIRKNNQAVEQQMRERGDAAGHLSWILVVLYALSLIPLLLIAGYDYPSADDYSMGLGTRLVFEQTGSVLAVLGKIVTETIRYYRTWIGYYTSCLFTTVSPSTFGDGWYWLAPVIVLAGLHIGVISFLYALMEKALGMSRSVRRCMTVLVLFLMVQLMPEGSLRVEAFYWYSGAGNYTLTFAVGLLYLACLILCIYGGRDAKHAKNGWIICYVLACIFGLLAGGGNYLSALSYAILSVLFLVVLFLVCSGRIGIFFAADDVQRAERKTSKFSMLVRTESSISFENITAGHALRCGVWKPYLALPALLQLAGFAASCMAPGNRIRGGEATGYGAVKAILLSLYYTLSYPLNQWMNWAVLLIAAAAGVVFWIEFCKENRSEDNGKNRRRLSYRYPLLALVFAYGLVSAVVTPALYAQGNMDAGRIQSTFWLHWVLILIILEWYLVGWLYWHVRSAGALRETLTGEKFGNGIASGSCKRTLACMAALFIVFSALTVKANPRFYTAASALTDLINGSAAQYGKESQDRLAVLQDDSITDAELPLHTVQPELLFYLDLSTDPGDWANVRLSEYFHKNSVRGVNAAEE